MGASGKILAHLAWSGMLLLTISGVPLPLTAQQTAIPQQQANGVSNSNEQTGSVELPDSPGATITNNDFAKQQAARPQPWELASASPVPQQSQTQPSSSAPPQQGQPVQKPVGTATAEAPNATGVAASQPAGVAIAPAKQHRARTIVIRVGAIMGAGVAVGSVVALTAGTSSKPPGAH